MDKCGCGYHFACYWNCSDKGRDPAAVKAERDAARRHRELMEQLQKLEKR